MLLAEIQRFKLSLATGISDGMAIYAVVLKKQLGI
jgi:hypothetical protein